IVSERRISTSDFTHTAEIAGSLRHPGIVRVYDFKSTQLNNSEPPVPYLVMELVKGELLMDLLARKGASGLGQRRAVALMHGICQAVGAAHRRDIIHLHLEPESVFVLPPGRNAEEYPFRESVKVFNFGYQRSEYNRVIDTLTVEPQGRPVMYMSPERCQGLGDADVRTDVYSLGVMLYEMIVGRPPFVEGTPLRIARQHLENPPPPFPPELEALPGLEAVVMKALSKDRNERQADANVLLAELEEVMSARRAV
ncbi:MAG TPA: serine/threonine-protein kinase, partial [Pyrinomonadaceae bacterium]